MKTKMVALIKRGIKLEKIEGEEISERANIAARKSIYRFMREMAEEYGPDYRISTDDLEIMRQSLDRMSNYSADKILKPLINERNKEEIKRLLNDLFNSFNISPNVCSHILKSSAIVKFFYSDKRGNILYNRHIIEEYLSDTFGDKLAAEMEERLYRFTQTNDYKVDMSFEELQKFIDSKEDIIGVNKDNFEELLYVFDKIGNPRTPAGRRHQCYSCGLLSPLTCKKAEYVKKPIYDYRYIVSGYQIYEIPRRGEPNMVCFEVGKCSHYIRGDEYVLTPSDYEATKRDNQKLEKKKQETKKPEEVMIGAPRKDLVAEMIGSGYKDIIQENSKTLVKKLIG